jgi:hypothetical protein
VYIIRSPFQLTGLYFVGHVWWLCVLCGPSSCVSEMKYGILRYNIVGLDIRGVLCGL